MKDVEMVEEEKLKVMHDKDESNFNCTYSFNGEDHTLGNLLRCILMKE
jgi:DNA-directed RNA polymerase subunit L